MCVHVLSVCVSVCAYCVYCVLPTLLLSKIHTALLALKRLKDECDSQLKEINYEDSIIFKNLYDHQTTDYDVLFAQYNNLTQEYNNLKECYTITLAQKNEYINERIRLLHQAIGECYTVVNRITIEPPPSPTDPSEAMSNQLA